MELLILGAEGGSKTVLLQKDTLSLGRAADNDLPYPNDPWLSRYHLRFEQTSQGWLVRDLNSRNGTIFDVEGLKGARLIAPGSRIYAGHLTIEIRDGSDSSRRSIVNFVPPQNDTTERRSTIITNLDQVLGQTRVGASKDYKDSKDSTLNTARVLDALVSAGRELAGHRPLTELFEVILNLSISAVDATRGVILTLEKNGELELHASKGEGFSISTAVVDRVIRAKESLMVKDAQLDDLLREQKSILSHRVHSFMAVPLQTGERVIGLIYLDSGDSISPFAKEDLDLLTVMANIAAIRIEHARLVLIEQAEKVMEVELAQASEIQRSLLPLETPSVPGYELAGFNLACRTVGGDYYDFIPYTDGRLAVLVGDVSGKGLAASLMMSSLQARVQMLAETNPEPALAVAILNRSLSARCPLGKFITFFYAVLDPATGKISYANAGHNYPHMICAEGTSHFLQGGGMVLGILASSHYEAYEAELRVGDTLVLFSDGVTEARSPDDKNEFGDERLAQFLLERRQVPTAEIISQLVDYLREWSGQFGFADDFTMLLIRRRS
jgi:sigma-B regulation protein RsbU (phosphoserine phosphatase)